LRALEINKLAQSIKGMRRIGTKEAAEAIRTFRLANPELVPKLKPRDAKPGA
jgi:hypothetical protein